MDGLEMDTIKTVDYHDLILPLESPCNSTRATLAGHCRAPQLPPFKLFTKKNPNRNDE